MSVPVLFSPHVQLAAAFYKEYLDFTIEVFPAPDPEEEILLSFRNQPLLIRKSQEKEEMKNGYTYSVDNIERYFRKVHQKARILSIVESDPNHYNGFILIDCEGNPIRFVEKNNKIQAG